MARQYIDCREHKSPDNKCTVAISRQPKPEKRAEDHDQSRLPALIIGVVPCVVLTELLLLGSD
jgi:hypothetical protein